MSDITEFQRSKLMHMFTIFYDINRDGVIQWDDFTEAIDKFCLVNNWTKDSKDAQNALTTLQLVWDGLRKYADENMDDEITKEEWFKMWEEYYKAAKNKTSFPDWLEKYANFMFDVTDTSGDKVVDKDEYRKAFKIFGLDGDACNEAFDKFSDEGKGLTHEEFIRLWHEFFLSNDPNAKGNFLFGPKLVEC